MHLLSVRLLLLLFLCCLFIFGEKLSSEVPATSKFLLQSADLRLFFGDDALPVINGPALGGLRPGLIALLYQLADRRVPLPHLEIILLLLALELLNALVELLASIGVLNVFFYHSSDLSCPLCHHFSLLRVLGH